MTEHNQSISSLQHTNAMEHQAIISQLKELAGVVERIEGHVKSTNGRVRNVEKARLVIVGVLIVIIPLFIFIVNTILYNTGVIKKFEQMHAKELSTSPNSQEVRK